VFLFFFKNEASWLYFQMEHGVHLKMKKTSIFTIPYPWK